MIAGLEIPETGMISVESGEVILDTANGIFLPPHRRKVRMVAQRPALFPHLSVIQNVGYNATPDTPDFLTTIMDLCRINHLRDKRPSDISGGERQRVALARTLAAQTGCLLLLDEPFTGLEAILRDELISDLRTWTRDQATLVLLVTHDLGEVFAADAHVLKMESGRIIAQGPAAEVLAEERNRLFKRLQGS
jgi:molybdate transport system ATP-binding protein